MRYLILLVALLGVVDASLALKVHYDTGTEPCSINEHWDCGIVNHSPFSVIHGVPVAAIGIAGYLLTGALAFARRKFLLLLTASVGFDLSLCLTLIEKFVLEVWCLYCVLSQGIIALLLLISLGWFTAEYLALRRARPQA